MKKKGQALVEFIIILPIFIMLVLGVIDIGKILYSRIIMEEKMSDVITYYENDNMIEVIMEKLDLDNDIYSLVINEDNEYINFSLVKKIDIITPGLNFVFENPYQLTITRSIENE